MRGTARRVPQAWNRFWFEPQETSTLALFRIAFGLVITLWTASQLPYLFTFYGPDGVLPQPLPLGAGQWGLLHLANTVAGVSVVWLATLLAGMALTVGLRTRLASVIVFVGLLALERRNPLVLNSGDALLKDMAFFLMLAPAGAALSVDRWRTRRSAFWTAPKRAPWALRLLQLQLCVVYVSTVWAKMQGETWRGGTAVSYAMRIADISRYPLPDWLTDVRMLTEAMTFGTLLLELAIPILVWNRTARPWVLGAGLLMHLSIEVSIMVGFFSMAVACLYLVFVPPETAGRWITWLRLRVERRSEGAPQRHGDHPEESLGEPHISDGDASLRDRDHRGQVQSRSE